MDGTKFVWKAIVFAIGAFGISMQCFALEQVIHCGVSKACVLSHGDQYVCNNENYCHVVWRPSYSPPYRSDPVEQFPAIDLPHKPLDTDVDAKLDCWKDISEKTSISSGFPFRNDGFTPHNGVDFVSGSPNYGRGAPVRSLGAGYVIEADFSAANGNFVRVAQADGNTLTYIHLLNYAVAINQNVGAGHQIGSMNCTGNCGPANDRGGIRNTHVHVQVKRTGTTALLDAVDSYGGRDCTARGAGGISPPPPPPSGGSCGKYGCTQVP